MEELSQAKAWILSNTELEIALKPKIASLNPKLVIVDGTGGSDSADGGAYTREGEQGERGTGNRCTGKYKTAYLAWT
jgi:hypothetical protein